MRSRRLSVASVWLALPFLLCFASPEGAASGLKDILGKTTNFAILLGGLAFLLRKPLRSFIEKKAAEISLSLDKAKSARLAALRRKGEAEERLARLEEEVARIKREAEETGEREITRIKEHAEREMERIKRLTQMEIESQFKAAIRGLKEFTAELATRLAEEKLKRDLTLPDQTRLVERSIGQLAELYEKSTSS